MNKAFVLGIIIISLVMGGCTGQTTQPSQENNNDVIKNSEEISETNEIDFNLFRDHFREAFGQEFSYRYGNEDFEYYTTDKTDAEIIFIKNEKFYVNDYAELFDFSTTEGKKYVKDFVKVQDFHQDFIGIGNNHKVKVLLREVGYTKEEMVEELYVFVRDNSPGSVTASKILEWNYIYCAPNIVLRVETKADGFNKFSYTGDFDGISKAAHEQAKVLDQGINEYPVESNRKLLFNKQVCPQVHESFNVGFSTSRTEYEEIIK